MFLIIFAIIATVFSYENACNSCIDLMDSIKKNFSGIFDRTEVLEKLDTLPDLMLEANDNLISEEKETIADLLIYDFTSAQICATVGECDDFEGIFVTMTDNEKRQAIANKIISREGKNQYTQDSRRYQVDKGYSDCSSLVQWAEREVLGINVGDNTESQINSSKMKDVNLTISNGIPDESKMLVGDHLYFRGTDTGRKSSRYVGHVETYVGNGQISGHGSGIGPTRKNMRDYCTSRQNQSSPVPGGNKGLICVRRSVW